MLLCSDVGMQEEQTGQLSTPDLACSEVGSPVSVATGPADQHSSVSPGLLKWEAQP